jgi:TRAP-type C4-dicarboxylate transport system permease small subunit
VLVAVYLHKRGTLPWFEDLFPMYGGTWSSSLDNNTFTAVLVAFLVVTLVVAWTGWLLWHGSTRGALANLALLPIEAVFWLGFALPFPFVGGVARAAFIAAFLAAHMRRAKAQPPEAPAPGR